MDDAEENLSQWLLLQAEAARPVMYGQGGEFLEGDRLELMENFVNWIVSSRESINPSHSSITEFDDFLIRNRKTVEDWLDAYYVFPQLGMISEMVQRTLKFTALEARVTSSTRTNIFLTEPTRCYIRGLCQSTVALGRAALEQSLKDVFFRLDGPLSQDLSLGSLLFQAEQRGIFLSPDSMRIAKTINKKCNELLHNRPIRDEDEAWSILVGVRYLVAEIYSGQTA